MAGTYQPDKKRARKNSGDHQNACSLIAIELVLSPRNDFTARMTNRARIDR